MITNEQIVQQDWDKSISDHRYPTWDGVGCYYCGSSEEDCPVCRGEYLDKEEK